MPLKHALVVATLVVTALLHAQTGGALASSASSASGDAITATAKTKTSNTFYTWGGNGPRGFDCSGFTTWVYAQHGITLPRSSVQQYNATQRISRSQLRPGDLVFKRYSSRNGSLPDHVSIYIGNGRTIGTSTSLNRVVERGMITRAVVGYGRVKGVTWGSSSSTANSEWATRAETAKALADVMDLNDRPNRHGVTTHGGAVGAVLHAGIMTSYADGKFKPHRQVTPRQLAVFLKRADVTRAQAARVTADVMGLSNRRNSFGVTTHGGAVGAVHHARVGFPYRDGLFRPHTKLTNRQADLWMGRADQ